jgi:hypothetical protein
MSDHSFDDYGVADAQETTRNNRTDTLRTPPHAPEAEQSVIGGLMLLSMSVTNAELLEIIADLALAEHDFYRRDHRLIFRAIYTLAENGTRPDAVTLGEWIEANGMTEQVGGTHYLIELVSSTPSAANIRAYGEIMRAAATQRRLIEVGTEIVNFGFAPDGASPADLYHRAFQAITTIESRIVDTAPPPVDLFGDFNPPALNRAFLPPPIASFVFEASAVKGSPPEVLALSALVAIAAACDDGFKLQCRPNEPGWLESARLWGMIVGEPSTKKTPAMKLAFSGLSDMNVDMIGRNQRAMAEYDRQMQVYKLAEKGRVRAEVKGDGLPEPLPTPDKPREERIITADFTVEGLSRLLVDNPRGMLCFTDELAGWFGAMGRYSSNGGGSDRAAWLEFYQGGPKPIDRAGRTVLVPNASVNVIGAIQPAKMRALAANMDDDGLLQRFIPIVLPKQPLMPSDDPEPTHLIRAYADLIQHLWNTRPGNERTIITMSDEAIEVRKDMDHWRTMLAASDGLPDMLRSAVTKYEGLFPRLCLTYHMIACAASRRFPTSIPLQGATARRVADLIKHWLFPNALAFYTGVMGKCSPGFELARAGADYLLAAAPSRVTRRDITHGCNAWRGAPEWQQQAALAALEQAGWLIPGEAGVKGAKAWMVSPRALRDFSARAAGIRQRRKATAELMAALREKAAAERAPGA